MEAELTIETFIRRYLRWDGRINPPLGRGLTRYVGLQCLLMTPYYSRHTAFLDLGVHTLKRAYRAYFIGFGHCYGHCLVVRRNGR